MNQWDINQQTDVFSNKTLEEAQYGSGCSSNPSLLPGGEADQFQLYDLGNKDG
eukprot:c49497_g1_i1 orf=185-343(+)